MAISIYQLSKTREGVNTKKSSKIFQTRCVIRFTKRIFQMNMTLFSACISRGADPDTVQNWPDVRMERFIQDKLKEEREIKIEGKDFFEFLRTRVKTLVPNYPYIRETAYEYLWALTTALEGTNRANADLHALIKKKDELVAATIGPENNVKIHEDLKK